MFSDPEALRSSPDASASSQAIAHCPILKAQHWNHVSFYLAIILWKPLMGRRRFRWIHSKGLPNVALLLEEWMWSMRQKRFPRILLLSCLWLLESLLSGTIQLWAKMQSRNWRRRSKRHRAAKWRRQKKRRGCRSLQLQNHQRNHQRNARQRKAHRMMKMMKILILWTARSRCHL